MSTTKTSEDSSNRLGYKILALLGTLILVLCFFLTATYLDTPKGSIAGKISIERPGFGVSTYNLGPNTAYVIAAGPRKGNYLERGVYARPDGTFQIDRLPIGEYHLRIKAPGYQTSNLSEVFIDQGKVTQLKTNVALNLINPYVTIASNQRVFTSKEKPKFWISSDGGVKANVKIYKKDFLNLICHPVNNDKKTAFYSTDSSFSLYKPNNDIRPYFLKEAPLKEFSRKLELDSEDWSRADFAFSDPLPAGDYVAVAEVTTITNKTAWNIWWFSVSDLGLVVKHAPNETIVRAIDLNTKKAIPDVDLNIMRRSTLASGASQFTKVAFQKTDSTGIAKIPVAQSLRSLNDYELLVFGQTGANQAYGNVPFWQSSSEKYKTYFYTEKPVYRLGQTVLYKTIVRNVTDHGLATPKPGTQVELKIEDPDNNELATEHARTNNFGSFSGTFTIPNEGKTGAYQLTIKYPDGTEAYERFEVAQYRKPEYLVEVNVLTPRIAAGSKLKARIKANYFFGAPVTNAQVKYTVYQSVDWALKYKLMPRPEYYDFFDGWDNSDDSSGGTYVMEGTATTDNTGEAIVEIDTESVTPNLDSPFNEDYRDKRYRVEAEVTDLSRLTVVGSGTGSVTAGNFAVFLEPSNYVMTVGQKGTCKILATTYEGKPVANQAIDIQMIRWIQDKKTWDYSLQKSGDKQTVTTDAQGNAIFNIDTKGSWPTDTYYITATTHDAQGHFIFNQESIWIANANAPYLEDTGDAEQEMLSIKLDKPVYKPGATAKAMITAPTTGKEGLDAIVAIESTGVKSYRVIPLTATAQEIDVPILDSYAPNVYLTVSLVTGKKQFYNQSQMIRVSPANHFLSIKVKTDKERYLPGDTVNYEIKATKADGSPAANTELSLGVVDESIYSIRPETAQNIQSFFFSEVPNWVTTICSFPQTYSGGPDKIEPRVRKDFRDTAAWLPQLVTNKDGIAKAQVKLPDNLTTWRATVRGISMLTDVGSTIQKVIATQPILARLALPRFFTQGDEGSIAGIVHNYSDKAESITLTLNLPTSLASQQKLQQVLKVEPDKAQRYTWTVKAKTPGTAVIGLKAIGSKSGDALEQNLPIVPFGLAVYKSISGVISQQSANFQLPITLPHNIDPSTLKASLKLSASSIGTVIGNLGALIDYPYGCAEQTTSKLIPSAVADQIHKKLGITLAAADQKKLKEVYDQSLTRLKDMQQSDGGWGWWYISSGSDPYLTSYVIEGLSLLNDDRAKEMKEPAITWLKQAYPKLLKQLQDPQMVKNTFDYPEKILDLSQMLYTISASENKSKTLVQDPKTINWLRSQIKSIPPEGLSMLTLALKQNGKTADAHFFYERLLQLANHSSTASGELIDWDHSPALLRKLDFQTPGSTDLAGHLYTYRFTGIESTALALNAILAMEPNNEKTINAVKQWILLQRDKDGWYSTKTTARVLQALANEEFAQPSNVDTNFAANLLKGSLSLAQAQFNQSNKYDKESSFDLGDSLWKSVVNLTKEGTGRLIYSLETSFFKMLEPGKDTNEPSSPSGLKIERQFMRLVPVATTEKNRIRFKAEELDHNQLKAGETVLMRLNITSPISLPYLIVEAPLPSGAEVVNDNPKLSSMEKIEDSGESSGDEGSDSSPPAPRMASSNDLPDSPFLFDWGNAWWSHQDILDTKIVYFVTSLRPGQNHINTMVRVELPGKLQVNPVTLQGMYSKAISSASNASTLSVSE
jgi:uncharacterized protein YfaS (alpha-2-macroglobulin family)